MTTPRQPPAVSADADPAFRAQLVALKQTTAVINAAHGYQPGRSINPPGPRSISDDDICSDCPHCSGQPNGLSRYAAGWPGQLDADDYVTDCPELAPAA